MQSLVQKIEAKYKKSAVVDVRSGDTVRVHQEIVEGGKKRIQIFEGLVIRTDRKSSLTSSITVRKVASGVGVEKSYMLHAPSVLKVEVTKRSKVRRNYLSYMRNRSGKSARLAAVDFDREGVNTVHDAKAEAELEEAKAESAAAHEAEQAEKAKESAAEEAKATAALAAHDQAKEEA
jgi:large subunit ribosomal protein L19